MLPVLARSRRRHTTGVKPSLPIRRNSVGRSAVVAVLAAISFCFISSNREEPDRQGSAGHLRASNFRGGNGEAFMPIRRSLLPSWVRFAQAEDSRASAVATLPPPERAAEQGWQLDKGPEVGIAFKQPFEDPATSGPVKKLLVHELKEAALGQDPLDLVHFADSRSSHEATYNVSAVPATNGMAAAGAFLTLAAGMMSQEAASLLRTMVAEASVAAPVSGVEGKQSPWSVHSEALKVLNNTAQQLWERGSGSLGVEAAALLQKAGQLWAAFDRVAVQKEEAVVQLPGDDPSAAAAQSSLGIAVRTGSARQDGKDWILPLEAQLFRRNEGQHAMVLALCRQVLFRSLHGISETDFEGKGEALYEERARLIFRSLQLPLSNDRSLQRLEVRIGGPGVDNAGWRALPPTDAYGIVEANVRFHDGEVSPADRLTGRVSVEVRLSGKAQHGATSRPQPRPAQASVQLVSQQGLAVISDIDDTVKVTEVFSGIKAVLRNTFLRAFKPVPGMSELFNSWDRLYGASFFYVSKSPPELHEPLSEFLRNEGFPVSSLHLCPLLGRNRANFKLRQVQSLLAQFPGRRFVLVGDSGEKDAEVYAAVIRSHPDQVVKALIRNVGGEERAKEAFQGIPAEKWQVFTHASEVTMSLPILLSVEQHSSKSFSPVEAALEGLKKFGFRASMIPQMFERSSGYG